MSSKLTSPSEIRRILDENGLRPKKRLGQNFLADANVLGKIISAAEISPDDFVLEIGPGLGTLSRELARTAKKLVCVETDRDMVSILHKTLSEFANVEIVESDFLRLKLDQFLGRYFGDQKCTVLGNLPYYITTPLISILVESKNLINRMVLMVQKEVAQRLAAKPAENDYSSFGIYVNYNCRFEIIAKVPRTVFYPAPEVDSALIKLEPRSEPAVKTKDEAKFFEVVRAAFGKRRKTLLNALSSSENLNINRNEAADILQRAGIEPSRRGETLTMEEYALTADIISESGH